MEALSRGPAAEARALRGMSINAVWRRDMRHLWIASDTASGECPGEMAARVEAAGGVGTMVAEITTARDS